MSGNEHNTAREFEKDDAPDLSRDGWPEKFAKAKVSAAGRKAEGVDPIRLSPEVIDHFKAGGRGWQTRIDEALREWIGKRGRRDRRAR